MRKQWRVYLIVVLVTGGFSEWLVFSENNKNVPGSIYPVNLSIGDRVRVELQWRSNDDLDIYMYAQGSNLLSNSFYLYRQRSSTNQKPQILQYAIVTEGTYYFRVHRVTGSAPTGYLLNIFINETSAIVIPDTIISSSRNSIQLNLKASCSMRITHPITNTGITIYIFSPSADVTDNSQAFLTRSSSDSSIFDFNPDTGGNWYFTFDHTVTTTTSIAPYEIIFLTRSSDQCSSFCSNIDRAAQIFPGQTNQCICASPFVWNSNDTRCLLDCSLVLNSNANAIDNSTCQCQQNYYWKSSEYMCELKQKCDSPFQWYQPSNLCIIKCEQIEHTRQQINHQTCSCEGLREWSYKLSICEDVGNLGLIIGCTIGGVFFVIGFILVIVLKNKKRKVRRIQNRDITNDVASNLHPEIVL